MDILIADLDENTAALAEQVARHGQPVSQVSQVGMDAVAPGIAKRAHLFGLAGDMVLGAVLDVAAGGRPLEIGVEFDAIGRVKINALHLAAQAFALGQRRHHRQAVAGDHPVRPVLVVLVEFRRRLGIGQAVEIGKHVELWRLGARLSRGAFLALALEIIDDDLGVQLLLDIERRRRDDQVRPVLLILAAPDQLRIKIAIAALIGQPDRRLVLRRHHRLQLRRGNILARGAGVFERLNRKRGLGHQADSISFRWWGHANSGSTILPSRISAHPAGLPAARAAAWAVS